MIVCPDNLKVGKVFGERHGFRVCTGTRYMVERAYSDVGEEYQHDQQNRGEIFSGYKESQTGDT